MGYVENDYLGKGWGWYFVEVLGSLEVVRGYFLGID